MPLPSAKVRPYRRNMLRVWIEQWQHECCGEAFAVGDVVSWPVVPLGPYGLDGLVRLLGKGLAGQVRWYIERHDEAAAFVGGRVASVFCVFCDLELVSDERESPHSRTAPGTTTLHERDRSTRHEHDELRHWAGYLVHLTEAPDAK